MTGPDTSFQQRLQSALDNAIGEFNRTHDPNQAVAKTACDYGFTPPGTQRLLETFNRARTIFHFSTAMDKSAEFPLAEPEKVMNLMYTPETAVKEASFESTMELEQAYAQPETDYTKTASTEDFSEFLTVKTAAPCEESLFNRINLQRDWFSRAIQAAVNTEKSAEVYIDAGMSKLAQALRASAKSVDDIALVFATFKEACARDGNLVSVSNRLPEYFDQSWSAYAKQDLPTLKFARVLDTRDIDQHLKTAEEIAQYISAAASAIALREGFEKDASEFESELASLLHPQTKAAEEDDFLVKRAAPPQGGKPPFKPKPPADEPQKAPATKSSPFDLGIAKAIGRQAEKGFGNFFDHDLFRVTTGAAVERNNKELSGQITNLHRQLMLEDLLQNDPVLSEADPQTVVSAYQALLNLAPYVANQKPTIVSILRGAVHAPDAFSPYDADALTRLDTSLRNVMGVSPQPSIKGVR